MSIRLHPADFESQWGMMGLRRKLRPDPSGLEHVIQAIRPYKIGLAFAVLFGCWATLIGTRPMAVFDDNIIAIVQGWETARLTRLMIATTSIGTGLPAILIGMAVMALLIFRFGQRRELLLFVIVVIGSGLCNGVLKAVFHRARPTLHRLTEAAGFSFPSGHSMAAFSMYGIVAYLLWKHVSTRKGRLLLLAVCSLLVAAIGISRIYLGVHYPSDVVGGYLASGCLLAASVQAYRRMAVRTVSDASKKER